MLNKTSLKITKDELDQLVKKYSQKTSNLPKLNQIIKTILNNGQHLVKEEPAATN